MRKFLWALVTIVAFVMHQAEAQTASPLVTCQQTLTGQPYSACTSVGETTTPTGDTNVLFCSSGAVLFAARETCGTQTWIKFASLQSFSWILTGDGWQRAGSIVAGPNQPPPAVPAFTAFMATPGNVEAGGSVSITWSTSNMQSCTASWKSGAVPANGSETVTVQVAADYTVTCIGSDGKPYGWSHAVGILAPPAPPVQEGPVMSAFALDPLHVVPGGSSTLTWNAVAETCTGSWASGAVPVAGSTLLTPTQNTDLTITCARDGISRNATMTLRIIVPPTAHAALPKCWPVALKAHLGPGPQGKYVLFWDCDTPKGIAHYAHFFGDSNAALNWIARGKLTKAEYDAAFSEVSRLMTDEERAYAYEGPNSLVAKYGVRAVVATNGTSLSRPVYAANPDGTRNTKALASARVSVGARCQVGDRLIDAGGKGTGYYSVEGAENVATPATDLLGKAYAVCTRTDPIGIN